MGMPNISLVLVAFCFSMSVDISGGKDTNCFEKCLKLCQDFDGDFNQVIHQVPMLTKLFSFVADAKA
jgi:hypothetical protein